MADTLWMLFFLLYLAVLFCQAAILIRRQKKEKETEKALNRVSNYSQVMPSKRELRELIERPKEPANRNRLVQIDENENFYVMEEDAPPHTSIYISDVNCDSQMHIFNGTGRVFFTEPSGQVKIKLTKEEIERLKNEEPGERLKRKIDV
jgi:hypothetical protein